MGLIFFSNPPTSCGISLLTHPLWRKLLRFRLDVSIIVHLQYILWKIFPKGGWSLTSKRRRIKQHNNCVLHLWCDPKCVYIYTFDPINRILCCFLRWRLFYWNIYFEKRHTGRIWDQERKFFISMKFQNLDNHQNVSNSILDYMLVISKNDIKDVLKV